MALPPGSVLIPDKVQFPASGAGGAGAGSGAAGGNEIVHHQPHHPRPQWFALDERDAFISWLRGEFAAANAIIDSLCQHLRVIGEPGEYDLVIGCIQQRRCNWNPVLHMQQYFSIGEVIFALQQVALRKQQQQQQQQQQQLYQRFYYDQPRSGGKGFRRSTGVGFNKGHTGGEVVNGVANSNDYNHNSDNNGLRIVEVEKSEGFKSGGGGGGKFDDEVPTLADDKKEATANTQADSQLKSSENSEGNQCVNLESESLATEDGSCLSEGKDEKPNLSVTSKIFVSPEIIDGKTVNVVDGLRLYDQFLNEMEIVKLISLVSEWKTAGRRGQFQGQTYVHSKRPSKGHGREMIQFGTPVVDVPVDDDATGTSKERKLESIPTLLQDVIERLVSLLAMAVKPDSCVVDIYNEGDHSQPYMWPPWYGKPVSILSLTECDITFGRVIVSDHPGDYRGSLKLTLSPGSVLVMQGKSSDFAKHALPAIKKQRILVTFTKSQPRKFAPGDSLWLHSTPSAVSSHWAPPPSRSPNHIRHSVPSRSTNHFVAIPATGVLPAPPLRPQMPPPNGVQPLFVAAPIAAPMPFPAPVPLPQTSAGWPTAPPRHPPSCLPVLVPGTGVFLPPSGSGNAASPKQLSATATEASLSTESVPPPERESISVKSNHNTNIPPKEKLDMKSQRQDSNGTMDGQHVTREDEKIVDSAVDNNSL